jgi:hypothetical protein
MSGRDLNRIKMMGFNHVYEEKKRDARAAGNAERVSVKSVERWLKLPPGKLANFRANLPRNKTPIPDDPL